MGMAIIKKNNYYYCCCYKLWLENLHDRPRWIGCCHVLCSMVFTNNIVSALLAIQPMPVSNTSFSVFFFHHFLSAYLWSSSRYKNNRHNSRFWDPPCFDFASHIRCSLILMALLHVPKLFESGSGLGKLNGQLY